MHELTQSSACESSFVRAITERGVKVLKPAPFYIVDSLLDLWYDYITIMDNKNKPLEAEVFNAANISLKKGFVARETSLGAYVYDPKPPKNETPDSAEWFPYQAPNGLRTVVFGGQ